MKLNQGSNKTAVKELVGTRRSDEENKTAVKELVGTRRSDEAVGDLIRPRDR